MEAPHALIAKYLAGQTSHEENKELLNWCQESSVNEALFNELKDVWELTHKLAITPKTDKERVWNKITENIRIPEPIRMYSRSTMVRIAGIAASIAVLLTLSFSLFFLPGKNQTFASSNVTISAPKGQKTEIQLPDSTFVWLNSGSILTYSTAFNTENRKVRLQGEAFFDVNKNTGTRFEVSTGLIGVTVYGTAFNVKAYENDEILEVSLLRGNISLTSEKSGHLLTEVKPDQKVKIARQTMQFSVVSCDAETEGIWRYGRMKIESASMEEVIHKMERWYGVNIHLAENKDTRKYWLTIKTESLTEMLELINKITPINYSINGEEVHVRYR